MRTRKEEDQGISSLVVWKSMLVGGGGVRTYRWKAYAVGVDIVRIQL